MSKRLGIITGPYPDIDVPQGRLTPYVLRHAMRLADRPALIDGATGRTLTYGELEQRVRRLGGGRRRQHRVPHRRPDERWLPMPPSFPFPTRKPADAIPKSPSGKILRQLLRQRSNEA